jgi:hypothetical protein
MSIIAKNKTELTENKIKDITFFEEDISEMSNQLTSAESLYKNLYGLYRNLTEGKYVNIKSPRDIAEIAKALVQIRSLCSDTAFKRHQIRKNVSDIVFRNHPDDVNNEDVIKEAARTIINEVRGYIDDPNHKTGNVSQVRLINDGEKIALDKKVKEYIENGDINLSTNDKLIGVADYVKFKYDVSNENFIAVDERTDIPIPGFPKERLPKGKISRKNKNDVVTNIGDTYEIFGDD